jgi:hypothetical protein
MIELWCQQAGLCMSAYAQSTYKGMGKGVDGTACQTWHSGTSVNESTTWCVTEAGALLDLAFDYHSGGIDVVARTHFANFTTTVDQSKFIVTGRSDCVDLRAATPTPGVDEEMQPVNSLPHIVTANKEAAGHWHAAPSAVFEGYTLKDASSRLGLLDGFGFALPPPTLAHRDALTALEIPDEFDAREKWGGACASVTSIRNQGDCGGCW